MGISSLKKAPPKYPILNQFPDGGNAYRTRNNPGRYRDLLNSPGRTLAVVSWYMPKDMNLQSHIITESRGLTRLASMKSRQRFWHEKEMPITFTRGWE